MVLQYVSISNDLHLIRSKISVCKFFFERVVELKVFSFKAFNFFVLVAEMNFKVYLKNDHF